MTEVNERKTILGIKKSLHFQLKNQEKLKNGKGRFVAQAVGTSDWGKKIHMTHSPTFIKKFSSIYACYIKGEKNSQYLFLI